MCFYYYQQSTSPSHQWLVRKASSCSIRVRIRPKPRIEPGPLTLSPKCYPQSVHFTHPLTGDLLKDEWVGLCITVVLCCCIASIIYSHVVMSL